MEQNTVSKIKTWIEVDNQLRKLNEKAQLLRNRKKELEDSLVDDIHEQELINTQVNISDGHIKFVEKKVTENVTLKFIKKNLESFFETFKGTPNADIVYKYIIKNRKTDNVISINRKINKED